MSIHLSQALADSVSLCRRLFTDLLLQTERPCLVVFSGLIMLVPCHMINNRSEVGGSIQLNRLKALMVRFKNPLHAITVRVLNVAILRKNKNKT